MAEKYYFLSPRRGEAQGNTADVPVAPDVSPSLGLHVAVPDPRELAKGLRPQHHLCLCLRVPCVL